MQRGTLAVFALAVPAVLSAAGAHARDCSGYNTHVLISAEVTEPAKGHSLMTFRNHDMLVTNDPKHVLNMAMGECAGTMLTTPDGKMAGAGYCLRRDNDGDTQSIDWVWPKGAERGSPPVARASSPAWKAVVRGPRWQATAARWASTAGTAPAIGSAVGAHRKTARRRGSASPGAPRYSLTTSSRAVSR